MKKTLVLIFMSGIAILTPSGTVIAAPETIDSNTPSHQRPVIEEAEFGSGVSIEDVQHAICQGQPYGRKSYSPSEQEAACQRYEKLTGIPLERRSQPPYASIIVILILSLLTVSSLIYAIYRHRRNKNKTKRVRSRKASYK